MTTEGAADTCPSVRSIEEFLEGKAVDPKIARHAAECDSCKSLAVEIKLNNKFLSSMRAHMRAVPHFSTVSDGSAIPGYQIIREIARGGQGVVFEAIQTRTKRRAAIKTITAMSPVAALRFKQEVEVVASLKHPGVVSVFDTGSTPDGRLWVAMEFVDGRPFDDWAARTQPPRAQRRPSRAAYTRILAAAVKVCDAVQHAHQRGVIHRDLKPGNILVGDDDQPRVLDFGIAKILGEASHAAYHATLTGEFIGTPAYAAPEQVAGQTGAIGTTTDVYALGVMLYEALTGKMPYPITGSMLDIARVIREVEPARPSDVDPGIDDELATIILKTLSKSPDRRYQSAADLRADLVRYLAGEAIEAKRDSTFYFLRKSAYRHRWAISSIAAIGCLLVILIVLQTISASRLRVALADSTRQQARAVGMTGAVGAAEQLLWPLLKAQRRLPSFESKTALFGSPPRVMELVWAMIDVYSHQPCAATVGDPRDRAQTLNYSRDGRSIWARHASGRMTQWSLDDAQPLHSHQLLTPSPDSTPLGNSRDGSSWAARDKKLGTLLYARGAEGAVTQGPLDVANNSVIAFSDDGSLIAAYEPATNTASVFDTVSRQRLATRRIAESPVGYPRVAWSPDSSSVALCGHDTDISLWNWRTDAAARTLALPRKDLTPREQAITPMIKYSPNGDRLMFVASGNQIVIWALRTQDPPVILRGPKDGSVGGYEFSPDGQRVLIERETAIDIWDLGSASIQTQIKYESLLSANPVFGPDGKSVAFADLDGVIKVYDFTTMAHPLTGHSKTVNEIATARSADVAASIARKDGFVLLWPLPSGEARVIPDVDPDVTAVAISADGTRVVTGGAKGQVKLWNAADCTLIRLLADHGCEAAGVDIDPKRQQAASADLQGRIWLTDLSTGDKRELADYDARIPAVSFSPDGALLASAGGSDKTCRIHDLTSRRVLTLKHNFAVRALSFSPDSRHIVTSGDHNTVMVWDTRTGRLVWELTGHPSRVHSIAFHPDGIIVASGDRSGNIKFWDIRTGREIASFRAGEDRIYALSFSGDGSVMLSGGEPSVLTRWDLTAFLPHLRRNLKFHQRQPD